MHIGVLPYELRYQADLSLVAISDLTWLNRQVPDGEVLADLSADDQVIVYPSSKRLLKGFGNILCQVGLLLAEPYSIHGKYYRSIWLLRHKFAFILCRYPEYVEKYTNVIQFNPVETWINANQLDIQLMHKKPQLCSIIASDKTDLEGHKLRHQVVEAIQHESLPVSVLGRGYRPFEHKWQGLLPYRYSIVIENGQEPHYFTEKILDAMVCTTIPIYWGTPNIGDYFNTDGMHICNSFNDIITAIRNLTDKPDAQMLQAAEANRQRALAYNDLPQRICIAVSKYVDQ